jgi:hypothetical protein
MIALLKYGSGLPFYRLERLQESLGVPLPAATQWKIAHALSQDFRPVYDELIRQAGQGDLVHNDDTPMKILALMRKNARPPVICGLSGEPPPAGAATLAQVSPVSPESPGAHEAADLVGPDRTGIFTSGIVSITSEGHRIVLFFTGRQHAGENLRDVLMHRTDGLEPPIQMCDALSRNAPGELQTILGNCLAHGRRKFVEGAECFPVECRHVLEALGVIYHNDAVAREENMSPAARLQYHQTHSGPVMETLHTWLKRQIDEHLVEANSGLGKAIKYLLKHWEKLTLFLRQAGAPLDNNICERALKYAILHRKNSLFYKTQNGAHTGDLFMSLIFTCLLNGENPLEYLTALQGHLSEMASHPSEWMPWNYRQTLQRLSAAAAAR